MAKKPTRPKDANQLAKRIVDLATSEKKEETKEEKEARSAAAALLGSRGGKKGGPARAKSLSAKRRSEIAQKAAKIRWDKQKKEGL